MLLWLDDMETTGPLDLLQAHSLCGVVKANPYLLVPIPPGDAPCRFCGARLESWNLFVPRDVQRSPTWATSPRLVSPPPGSDLQALDCQYPTMGCEKVKGEWIRIASATVPQSRLGCRRRGRAMVSLIIARSTIYVCRLQRNPRFWSMI